MKKSILFLSMLLMYSITSNSQIVIDPDTSQPQPTDPQINIYLLAQGYTNTTMSEFDEFVASFKTLLLSTAPFNEFAEYIKFVKVREIATVDGYPKAYDVYNTLLYPPYKCTYDPNAPQSEAFIQFVNRMDAITQNIPGYNQKSYLMAVFNSDYYTGGGGKYPFVSDYRCNGYGIPYMNQTLLHEFGHTFGLLGDEYGTTNTNAYSSAFPKFFDRNITQKNVREDIPWNYLIDNATCVPTSCTLNSGCTNPNCSTAPGLFQGANYSLVGWYRPQLECKMQFQLRPFCLTCKDLLREMIKKHICNSNLNVTEDFISRHQDIIHWRKASNSLTSNSKIGNKITTYFVSENAIQLTDGFTAHPGSEFSGYIGDCNTIDIRNTYFRSNSSENYANTVVPPLESSKIDESSNFGLQIIPNPSNSLITITSDSLLINAITIFSIDGKLMYQQDVKNEQQFTIDVSDYSKGVYIVNVGTSNGDIISKKLIKN